MNATAPQHVVSITPHAQRSYRGRWVYAALAAIALLHITLSCIGITWGLPSRKIDAFLFGDGPVWPGEKIFRLAHADEKLAQSKIASTGADVDVNPIARPAGPVLLTGTDEDVAKIYLRYRLYTHQPDEMITMMALAGMRPSQLQLDPRLYQYGGLFIYPVGALIKLCGVLGLVDVRTDLVWYLDHPDEFGKFYVVARAYSAAWGLLGVLVVFALARRLANQYRDRQGAGLDVSIAGLLAALLFVLMPVVVCMSHEGKPHLPGAVLMLLSVYFATRALEDNRQSTIDNRKSFWLMCVCCGAAVGMVLSSWPICILIPLTAFLRRRAAGLAQAILGLLLAIAVYFLSNPYVLINYFANRQVLRSNFGNSLAMYEVSRIGEGLWRVLELTAEGTTLPVVVLGTGSLIWGLWFFRCSKAFWLLAVPAVLFFLQFVLIGAGKPGEYGRFGVFTDTALVMGTAVALSSRRVAWYLRTLGFSIVLLFLAGAGGQYCVDFQRDASALPPRLRAARHLEGNELAIAVPVEPAPYSCPPLNFAKRRVYLASEADLAKISEPYLQLSIDPRRQHRVISWAGTQFQVRTGEPHTWSPTEVEDSD